MERGGDGNIGTDGYNATSSESVEAGRGQGQKGHNY